MNHTTARTQQQRDDPIGAARRIIADASGHMDRLAKEDPVRYALNREDLQGIWQAAIGPQIDYK